MEKSSENKADKLITGERFTYVPVDLKMGWKADGDQFVGWSIDFPGVVVQAETLKQLINNFSNAVQVMSQYLYDKNKE